MRRLAKLAMGAGFIFTMSYLSLSGGCAYEPECDTAPGGILKDPAGIAFSEERNSLYITNANADLEYCSGFLARANLDNNDITHIPAEFEGEYFSFLGGIAISGNYTYATERSSNSLLKFDLDQEKVVGKVQVGEDPFGVAVIGGGPATLVLVTNMSSDDISVIDTNSMTILKQIPLSTGVRPGKIAILGEKAYVVQQNTGRISVIDIDPESEYYLEIINSIEWEGNCRGIASNGKSLYVSKRSPDSLAVIDIGLNSVIDAITLGSRPDGVAVNNELVLVVNFGSDNVYFLDATTNEITAIVEVGDGPTEIEIYGDYAYVTNYLSQNISVIDTKSLEVTEIIP